MILFSFLKSRNFIQANQGVNCRLHNKARGVSFFNAAKLHKAHGSASYSGEYLKSSGSRNEIFETRETECRILEWKFLRTKKNLGAREEKARVKKKKQPVRKSISSVCVCVVRAFTCTRWRSANRSAYACIACACNHGLDSWRGTVRRTFFLFFLFFLKKESRENHDDDDDDLDDPALECRIKVFEDYGLNYLSIGYQARKSRDPYWRVPIIFKVGSHRSWLEYEKISW